MAQSCLCCECIKLFVLDGSLDRIIDNFTPSKEIDIQKPAPVCDGISIDTELTNISISYIGG